MGINILRELEQKAERVNWEKKSRRIWYVLFSAADFTEEMKTLADTREELLLISEKHSVIL